MDLGSLMRTIGRGAARVPRVIGNALYDTQPILEEDTLGLPLLDPGDEAIAEGGVDMFGPGMDAPLPARTQQYRIVGEKKSMKPGVKKFLSTLPGALEAGVMAASTPNIAGGGGTDMMRALAVGMSYPRQRAREEEELRAARETRKLGARKTEADIEESRARAADYRAQAARQPTPPAANAAQVFREKVATIREVFPGATDQQVMALATGQAPPTARTDNMVEVDAETAAKLRKELGIGLVPDAEGKYRIPATWGGPIVRASEPPKLAGEAAKVDLLEKGFIAQGDAPEVAHEKALKAYQAQYEATTTQREASAGASGAGAAANVQRTTDAKRKQEIDVAADFAIAATEGQSLAEAAKNVLNPDYFKDWDQVKRAEVSAEIQRRVKKPGSEMEAVLSGTGGGPGSAPVSSATVKIRRPDGTTGSIPRANLAQAVRLGAIVVQ